MSSQMKHGLILKRFTNYDRVHIFNFVGLFCVGPFIFKLQILLIVLKLLVNHVLTQEYTKKDSDCKWTEVFPSNFSYWIA